MEFSNKPFSLSNTIIVVNVPHLNNFFIKLVFDKEVVLYLPSRIKSLPVSLRTRPATNEKLNISSQGQLQMEKKKQHHSHTTLYPGLVQVPNIS